MTPYKFSNINATSMDGGQYMRLRRIKNEFILISCENLLPKYLVQIIRLGNLN